MATNPKREPRRERSGWPGKGQAMTVDAYHELERLSPERKYEYIDGVAYLMSGGSVAHDRINRNIGYALDLRLSTGPCTAFGVDVQVLIGVRSNGKPHYVYPDATISCNAEDKRPDNTLIESPRVVIEVLSPGTEAKDRGVKFDAYQRCPTILTIVLVSQFAQHVELWQRNAHDPDNPQAWYLHQYRPGDLIELACIGIHIPIEEFYRSLVFDDMEEE